MVPLLASCGVKDGDKIYFASNETSIIFSLDLLTGKTEIVSHVPGELFFGNGLFGEFLRWNDQFILIPGRAKNIWITDRQFEHWEKIELEYADEKHKFFRAIIINNKIYAMRHEYPCSVCIDLGNHEIVEMDGTDENYFASAVSVHDEIYYPSYNSNKIFQYHVETDRVTTFEVGDGKYSGILYFEDHFYLAPADGSQLVVWNEREEKTICTSHCYALGIFEFKKKIYVPSWAENESFYLDSDGCVKEWNMADRFYMAKDLDDETYCLMDPYGKVYIFDCAAGDVKVFTSEIGRDAIKTAASKAEAVVGREMYYEGQIPNLQWYLTEMTAGMKEECRQERGGTVGSQIWELMR